MRSAISSGERRLELSDLVLFKAVAETGSVTRAGERLHRVQSNVTVRVKQLESRLGVSLFVRGRRGMALTPEGRRLAEHADRLLALAEEAEADLSAQPARGRFLVGALESAAAVRLPALLAALHARCPALEVHLTTGTTGALLARLREGALSAAFVSGAVTDPTLAAEPAFVEELVLITQASGRRGRGPADLRGRTLVAFGAGCTYRSCVEAWLDAQGVRPARTFEVASYHAMLACVAGGMGFAVAPRSVLRTSTARTAVRVHRPEARAWRLTTSLVWRAGDGARAVAALRELVIGRRRGQAPARPAIAPEPSPPAGGDRESRAAPRRGPGPLSGPAWSARPTAGPGSRRDP